MPDEADKILLARIDERTGRLVQDVENLQTMLANDYIHRTEFTPVRNVVYGMVGVILISVLTALVLIVVRREGSAMGRPDYGDRRTYPGSAEVKP